LIDTNIALYLLSGNKTIESILYGSNVYISFITELELLGYNKITIKEKENIKKLIEDCVIVDINSEIKLKTIELKQQYLIKLPDGIIAATSLFLNVPLITADKNFKKIKNLDITLYQD
jgi:predicted nucleic acid-binding protein